MKSSPRPKNDCYVKYGIGIETFGGVIGTNTQKKNCKKVQYRFQKRVS